MKTQVLFLVALLCSSAFCQLDDEVETLTIGDTGNPLSTPFDLIIGSFLGNCGVQRGGGSPPNDPSPFLYQTGATAGDCSPEDIIYAGSYAWAIFQTTVDGIQLIDSRTSRSGHTYEYSTLTSTPPASGTIFALRFDASKNQATFGKIVDGYQIYTKTSANVPAGINTFSGALACRHHLLLKVSTAPGHFLLDETGERTSVDGTDVYVGINIRTGKISAYPSDEDPCDTIEAIVEEQEDEEKSASLFSIAALTALGVIAI